MTIWKVDFEFLVEGTEAWRPDSALHLGDENGGAAVNFVREKLVGTEVEISVGIDVMNMMFPGGVQPTVVTRKIAEWRLIGLTKVGRLNFVDIQPLIAAGLIEMEPEHDEDVATQPLDENPHRVCAQGGGCPSAGGCGGGMGVCQNLPKGAGRLEQGLCRPAQGNGAGDGGPERGTDCSSGGGKGS